MGILFAGGDLEKLRQLHFPVDVSKMGKEFAEKAHRDQNVWGYEWPMKSFVDSQMTESFEDLTPGVYGLVFGEEKYGGPYGDWGDETFSLEPPFQPIVFNNLKYDENGKVIGSYSELNLTVYMDVICGCGIGDITIEYEPENGENYQVGETIELMFQIWPTGTWAIGYAPGGNALNWVNYRIKSGSTGNEWSEEERLYFAALDMTADMYIIYEVQPEDVGYPIEIEVTSVEGFPPKENLPRIEIPEIEPTN